MLSNSAAWASAIAMCVSVPILADTKVAASYVTDGQTTEVVTYVRGERVRYNYGKGESLLRQCDLKRITRLDDNAKTFLSEPAEAAASASDPATAPHVDVVDTQERKDFFGYSARHLRMTETTAGSKAHVETDGWYIDLKELPACISTAKPGAASNGYPVSYTATTYGDNGKLTSTLTMQVSDLTAAPVDATLFEIPSDYKEAGKAAEVPIAAKTSGATRVAAVPLRNKSDSKSPATAPYSHLLSELQAAKIEVLPMVDAADDVIKSNASQSQCDYVLYTELISVQKPPLSKVGGLLHKTPIVGKATDGDEYEARVDYRLVPLGQGTPLEASAVVKKGHSFNWVGAAMLASNFIPMTTAMKMLGGPGGLNPAMLNAVMSSGHPGGMMGGMDPMMGGMSMFLHAANPGAAGNSAKNPAGMDAAIAAALDEQGKALVAHLKK